MDNHESSDDEYYVLNVDTVNINKVSGGSDEKSWTKKVLVNNYPIEFKLDTGSETNILPSKYLHFLRPRPVLKKSSVKLEAYGGHHIFPKGSISVLLETKDRIVQADFLVVDLNSSVPILGLNSCVDLDLIKKVNVLLTDNDDVFTTNGSCSDQSSLEEGTLPKVSSVSQEMPDIPFYKVGIEIVHWAGTDYLVLIDYYSRWIEIRKMLTTRSTEVISCLKRIFCVHGIPAEVICDRYFFLSYEIRKFANEWNFNITAVSSYSQDRVLVGKAVKIVKDMLQKCTSEGKDINLYLLNYRNSPVADLPWSPSQLLFSRNLRTKLPVPPNHLLPSVVRPLQVSNKMSRNHNTSG
ncbi:uncharacterized protein LOC113472384 [Diaphorina citri]|uniref:Uncharacterized protein LOC113472384 n=1 Tax=Diaphorina citri TaxID=121845 RepID=A0A3Q0JM51_DIACI|nr:uncharacterized protein LOC113472384 [Diaphorina citri]